MGQIMLILTSGAVVDYDVQPFVVTPDLESSSPGRVGLLVLLGTLNAFGTQSIFTS